MIQFKFATAAAAFAMVANTAVAETEITWWHAMGGALGGVAVLTATLTEAESLPPSPVQDSV